jgi:DNA-binding MarR family transcriptional regulator
MVRSLTICGLRRPCQESDEGRETVVEPLIVIPDSFEAEFPDASRAATAAFLNVGVLAGAVRAAVEALVAQEGLPSMAAFNVLSVLAGDPSPLRPSTIAERVLVTRPTVTGLLGSLEARQLIRRTTSDEDRRSHPVELTPAGRQIVERLVPAMHRFERDLMTTLTDQELTTFLALVGRLQQRIGEIAPGARLGIA